MYGSAVRGVTLLYSLVCVPCYKVSGKGGSVGPGVTAVSKPLAAERIVEELAWAGLSDKKRTTQWLSSPQMTGKVYRGFERTTPENYEVGEVVLEDQTTKQRITIGRDNIEEKQRAGSPVSDSLTAVFPQTQLLDLIQHFTRFGVFE